jgi:hypothetical protein
MYNFISNYLSKENGAREERSDADADLSTAERRFVVHAFDCLTVDAAATAGTRGVQRAVLYNCPVLVRLCIRKPLRVCLFCTCETDAMPLFRASGVLRDMVQDGVKKHIYSTVESKRKG